MVMSKAPSVSPETQIDFWMMASVSFETRTGCWPPRVDLWLNNGSGARLPKQKVGMELFTYRRQLAEDLGVAWPDGVDDGTASIVSEPADADLPA